MGEQHLQVESYIPGREFAVEGLVTGGEFQPLAIFDKPDPLEGPFFEETIYVTPSREPAAVQQALDRDHGARRRGRSDCAMVRCTPNCATTPKGRGCWRRTRGPSAGSAPGRCGSKAACRSKS